MVKWLILTKWGRNWMEFGEKDGKKLSAVSFQLSVLHISLNFSENLREQKEKNFLAEAQIKTLSYAD